MPPTLRRSSSFSDHEPRKHKEQNPLWTLTPDELHFPFVMLVYSITCSSDEWSRSRVSKADGGNVKHPGGSDLLWTDVLQKGFENTSNLQKRHHQSLHYVIHFLPVNTDFGICKSSSWHSVLRLRDWIWLKSSVRFLCLASSDYMLKYSHLDAVETTRTCSGGGHF